METLFSVVAPAKELKDTRPSTSTTSRIEKSQYLLAGTLAAINAKIITNKPAGIFSKEFRRDVEARWVEK